MEQEAVRLSPDLRRKVCFTLIVHGRAEQEDIAKSAQKLQEVQHSVKTLKHLHSKAVKDLQALPLALLGSACSAKF